MYNVQLSLLSLKKTKSKLKPNTQKPNNNKNPAPSTFVPRGEEGNFPSRVSPPSLL